MFENGRVAGETDAKPERGLQASGEQGGGVVGYHLFRLDALFQRGPQHPVDEVALAVA